ncbi:phosphatidylserine decarboxylase-like protein [mine drainage metagenome]|uniref:Phosphatidylserine decarboxylase-like protein n=1 Tax=mine drainage metagenome TaxID=410659 RepID=T1BC27_9ZZZZ
MFAPGAGRPIAFTGALAVLLALVGFGAAPIGILRDGLFGLSAGFALVAIGLSIFFRDPERAPGEGMVSAADGRIRAVDLEGDRWRISVFMNVTDVHVNRFPVAARVEAIGDAGDGFRPAYREEARHNVRRAYRLLGEHGVIEVTQMTGAVARRLVSFVRPGEQHAKGDRLGMIALGSRVDVVLPSGAYSPAVRVGDRVTAGVTTIARDRA